MMQIILNLKNKEKYIKVDYETSYILQTKFKAIPVGRDKDFVYFNDTKQLRKDIANNDLQIRC